MNTRVPASLDAMVSGTTATLVIQGYSFDSAMSVFLRDVSGTTHTVPVTVQDAANATVNATSARGHDRHGSPDAP